MESDPETRENKKTISITAMHNRTSKPSKKKKKPKTSKLICSN